MGADAVVVVVDDLMFLTRIREAGRAAGIDVRAVRNPAAALEACADGPRGVFLDLDSARLPVDDVLRALAADPRAAAVPRIGFFSHVHEERAQAALANGATRVMARGAFTRDLPHLLAASTA